MTKNDAIKECLYKLVPNIETIFKNRIKKGSKIHLEQFIEVISKDSYNLAKDLNAGDATVSLLLRTLFPTRGSTNAKVCTYILKENNLKYCFHCKNVFNLDNFHKNKSNIDGVNTYCKACQLVTTAKTQPARTSKYRAAGLERTPKWSDLDKIKEIYDNCPIDNHVDHIIPLQGDNVSGLHIPENLQYLSVFDNLSKGNKYKV